jgi:hypothetical protein
MAVKVKSTIQSNKSKKRVTMSVKFQKQKNYQKSTQNKATSSNISAITPDTVTVYRLEGFDEKLKNQAIRDLNKFKVQYRLGINDEGYYFEFDDEFTWENAIIAVMM